MLVKLRPLNENERSYLEKAIKVCGTKLDWYVLKYDTVTTEYNNLIVFKTFADAYEEFRKTKPSYKNERIELMFAPDANDHKLGFEENSVACYKLFSDQLDKISKEKFSDYLFNIAWALIEECYSEDYTENEAISSVMDLMSIQDKSHKAIIRKILKNEL